MTDEQSHQSKSWSYTINNYTTEDHIPDVECKYRIQGLEVGENGTPHIQGYVLFNNAIRWKSFQKKYPSITFFQKSDGTPYQNFVYCSKDNNFKEVGVRPKAPKDQTKDNTFGEALQAGSVTEGIKIIKEKRPRDYCLHGESIERNLKRAKQEPFAHKFEAQSFNTNLQPLQKTTILCGPSNTGKTHYAAAHFQRPLVVSHIDELKSLSPDNDGIVFDDMSFKHWPIESVIHLVDIEFKRSINVRYGTINIPANTKKIFTHNTDNPFYQDDANEEQKEAIERRISRVNIHNNLY